MEYRIATEKDIDLLMDIREEMLRIVNGFDEDHAFSDELVRCSREYFLKGDQTTSIALDDGIAVGCASISYFELMPTFSHPTGKRAHIMNVYTKADHRRQGIARELMRMLIDEAKERGVTEISLDSTDSGRPLYEAVGFRSSDECMVMAL